MLDFWTRLLDTSDFPARWGCGRWDAGHGWLHILSDLGVWAAYSTIPIALFALARRRKNIPFRNLFWLFSAFILVCGTSHLMEAVTFWWPAYRLAGVLKLATALISWVAVIGLFSVLSRLSALRTTQELEEEIAERKRVETQLRASEQKYRLLVDGVRDYAIFMMEPTGHVSTWNVAAERIKGYTADEIIGKHFSCFYSPEDAAAGKTERELGIAMEMGRYVEEGWRVRRDGSKFWAHVVISAIHDDAGQLQGFAKATRDLTAHRRTEVAVLEAETLAKSVKQKEVMLQEIHHRVKNNMAVVSSLLQLQAGAIGDPKVSRVLREAQDRIHSMAQVHEHLYNSPGLNNVLFGEYAKKLAAKMVGAYQLPSTPVELVFEVGEVALTIEQSIPCGLILNELLSNCLKHAFRDRSRGKVVLSISATDTQCEIRVADDGIGMPEGRDFRKSRSLGVRLVQILASQLLGTVEYRSHGVGTEVHLVFPIESAEKTNDPAAIECSRSSQPDPETPLTV